MYAIRSYYVEVIAIGLMSYSALIPCFAASFIGDIVATHVWGVHHTSYSVDLIPALSVAVLLKVLLASVFFGLAGLCFSELTHFLKRTFSRLFKNPILKSAVGGVIVIALVVITSYSIHYTKLYEKKKLSWHKG